jgi:hypothetical protein
VQPTPTWKFWQPLSFWKVLLVFTLTNLVSMVIVVVLREGLKLPVPIAVAGGVGGLLAVLIVNNLARKARTASEPPRG